MDGSHVALAFLVVAGLSIVAFSMRILDQKGVVAAWILGMTVSLFGDLVWLIPMAVFTGTGFAATRYGKSVKQQFMPEASLRGWRNVVANGATAGAIALLHPVLPMPASYGYVTALAAVAADTWASEIGALSRNARSILPPFSKGARGPNGMVSALGQLAAVAGAALVAVAGFWALQLDWQWIWIPILAGFTGSQLDSLLGATLEERGMIGNSTVNFVASLLPSLAVLVALSLAWT